MAFNAPPKSIRPGLSLYANLLDPSSATAAPGTISRAPVVFKQPPGEEARQDEASAQKQQGLSAGRYESAPV